MGKAELDRIFVRGYDLNEQLLGKITFAQMVYLMLVGRMPSAEEGRMVDTMLIVLVDHGMSTGALAARTTYHSVPEALQGAVSCRPRHFRTWSAKACSTSQRSRRTRGSDSNLSSDRPVIAKKESA